MGMATFIVTVHGDNSEEVQKNLLKVRGVKSVRIRKSIKKENLSDSMVSELSLAKDWLSKEDSRWDKIYAATKKRK